MTSDFVRFPYPFSRCRQLLSRLHLLSSAPEVRSFHGVFAVTAFHNSQLEDAHWLQTSSCKVASLNKTVTA
eukprot:6160341-Amphidinium_carterae.1